MNGITLGIICGLALGIIDVLIMLPIKVADKRKRRESLVAAFVERFMLGFIIPNITIPLHPMVAGAILGLGLSLPTAIIVRVYAPILGIGVVGGIIVGFVAAALL